MSAPALSRGRVPGNREVSPNATLPPRGAQASLAMPTGGHAGFASVSVARSAAWGEASPEEEGGSRGKHGSLRGNEPKASDG
jgi:hypothetical protein